MLCAVVAAGSDTFKTDRAAPSARRVLESGKATVHHSVRQRGRVAACAGEQEHHGYIREVLPAPWDTKRSRRVVPENGRVVRRVPDEHIHEGLHAMNTLDKFLAVADDIRRYRAIRTPDKYGKLKDGIDRIVSVLEEYERNMEANLK